MNWLKLKRQTFTNEVCLIDKFYVSSGEFSLVVFSQMSAINSKLFLESRILIYFYHILKSRIASTTCN